MDGFFADVSGLKLVYLICAVIGGVVVVIRFVLQAVGADSGDAPDLPDDMPDDVDVSGDADASFTLLSVHTITSFLFMFGLVGLAMTYQGSGTYWSLLAATLAGCASAWLIGLLYRALFSLQSSGTIPTARTLGCRGKVYLTIPENGSGVVLITVDSRQREYDARAQDSGRIPTDAAVEVVEVQGSVLVVKAV